jgi:hypothetical protein
MSCIMPPDPDLQSLGGETLFGDQDGLLEAGSSKQTYCGLFNLSANQ